jgi:uncharacterized protein (TIGR03067 family)
MRQLLVSLLFVLSLTSFAQSGGAQDEKKMMEGTWTMLSAELAGKEFPEEARKSTKLVLKADTYLVTVAGSPDEGTVKIDAAKKPKAMDVSGTKGPNVGKTFQAIYELNGDTLRICYDLSGKGRPTEFKTTPGSLLFLVTYKREKS